ncbi:MAG: OB-fold nucleic acid binding domain-containing protein, partial [Actinomycetota bacterium]
QPQRFEDLIVEISLFRPGPVKSDMVKPYLQRRHGFERSDLLHPSLEPILRETNGVIVYHEQLIRAIAAVTGCSLADADHVRRNLDSERAEMPSQPGERFMDQALPGDTEVARWFKGAAVRNGFAPDHAERLWKEVFAFASFGFCKSHAAAFALPTYLSAWLKAHHPAEFYAGLLTHDPGMYPRRLIVADARQHGIPILPIDVNSSDKTYRAERVGDRLGVRLALSEVRDISGAEMDSIVTERAAGGPFRDLEDLWRRCDVSRPVLENLIHVGALDAIRGGRSRRELIWRAIELSERPRPERLEAGSQLVLGLDTPIAGSLEGLRDYSPLEETEAELEIAGIDARRHVMELYRPLMAELGCVTAEGLKALRNDSEVWVAGVKVASQTPAIRSGQRIIFVTIDDLTGPLDITVFERVQPWCAQVAFHSWLLLVRGVMRKRGGASRVFTTRPQDVGITIVVEELFDLAELARDHGRGVPVAEAIERQRARYRMGTIEPGEQPKARLWHASGGSAGR